MNGTPKEAAVPNLDEIASDPGKATAVSPEAARVLYSKCVVVLTALLPCLAASGPAVPGPVHEELRLLKPDAASARFNIPRRWLLAHAAQIPGTVRLSRKTVLFNEVRLERWLERHRAMQ